MKFISKFKIKNKLVFVLGGDGLIGKKTVELFLLHGAKVVSIDKKLQKKNKLNPNLTFEKIDVSNSANLNKKFNNIISKTGIPNIFINCSYPKTLDWNKNSFKEIKLNSYKKNVDLHLNSFAWSAKIIADKMKRNKGGSIILLSSIYGVVAQDPAIYRNTNMRESMTYSVIKGGINALTKQMSSYYGKYKIRVNCICAGGIYNKQSKKFVNRYKSKTSLGRMANTEDVAYSSIFLASDASSYITGSLFMLDGGWTTK
tara:strand:- start:821 stop:1591 length:771 start_codon:yes stop_codon:yes gene_type:complete